MRMIITGLILAMALPVVAEDSLTELERRNKAAFLECRELGKRSIAGEIVCWAPTAINFGRAVDRDEMRTTLEDIYRAFPDYRSELQEVIYKGDWIVQRSIASGTHLGVAQTSFNGGMLRGVKPTGKRFSVSQVHWWKLKDGKYVEHWAVRDDLSMMRQLGLIEPTLPSPVESRP